MVTILILSALVLLHELGHFLAAKLFGIRVEEFGIGLPPRLFRIGKIGDTEYSFNWLPIGGFVRLAGEDSNPTLWEKLNPLLRAKMFFARPVWQRASVLFAGVFMNFLIGVVLFSFMYSKIGIPKEIGNQVVVSQVKEGSPAEIAGIKPEEIVVRVGEKAVANTSEFITVIGEHKGEAIQLFLGTFNTDGTISDGLRPVIVIPRIDPPAGEGALGVGIVDIPQIEYVHYAWYLAPFYGAKRGLVESYGWGKEILFGLGHLFASLLHGKIPEGLSGPVGVYQAGKTVSALGWLATLRFAAIISINLAVFNLLPIPALDGGRLIFLVIEKIVGVKRTAKFENYVHMTGMVFLIGLLVLITWRDLTR